MGKASRFGCHGCSQGFTKLARAEHHCLVGGMHRVKMAECFCSPCARWFWNQANYNMHMRDSPNHNAEKKVELAAARKARLAKKAAKKAARLTAQVTKGGKVACHFCAETFKTPSAYAAHLESGRHVVSRYQVTRAVEMLRVVPQITIARPVERMGSLETSRLEDVEGPPEPFITTSGDGIPEGQGSADPGPPLGYREEQAGAPATVEPHHPVTVSPPSTTAVAFAQRKQGGPEPSGSLIPGTIDARSYVANDFIHLGIPYACPICIKTFRTVYSLTEHMNSPVHDPDAFMCPKCDRHFGYVSALIQHLESGCCKLASPTEIFERFERLTANFSRLLNA